MTRNEVLSQHFDIYHDCVRRVEALREHHKESDDSSYNPHSEYEGQAHEHLKSQKKQVQSNQHAHELQSTEPRPRCMLITLVRFCQVCLLYWTCVLQLQQHVLRAPNLSVLASLESKLAAERSIDPHTQLQNNNL